MVIAHLTRSEQHLLLGKLLPGLSLLSTPTKRTIQSVDEEAAEAVESVAEPGVVASPRRLRSLMPRWQITGTILPSLRQPPAQLAMVHNMPTPQLRQLIPWMMFWFVHLDFTSWFFSVRKRRRRKSSLGRSPSILAQSNTEVFDGFVSRKIIA